LAVDWQGEYASYDRPEDWLPKLEERKISPWILGQMILASHNEGRFRTRAAEEVVTAGSAVRLKVEGVTPLAPLAILSGRLNDDPLGLFGRVVVSYEESLDALKDSAGGGERNVRLPRSAVGAGWPARIRGSISALRLECQFG
jgi:hypothetical protein